MQRRFRLSISVVILSINLPLWIGSFFLSFFRSCVRNAVLYASFVAFAVAICHHFAFLAVSQGLRSFATLHIALFAASLTIASIHCGAFSAKSPIYRLPPLPPTPPEPDDLLNR